MKSFKDVDEYIASALEAVKDKLQNLRRTIKELVPEAGEKISYGIPTITLNGKFLIYFAGFKNHISIYPVTSAMEESIKEILLYRTGKGTLQFPLDKPLPMPLIRKIVKVRLQENQAKNKKLV